MMNFSRLWRTTTYKTTSDFYLTTQLAHSALDRHSVGIALLSQLVSIKSWVINYWPKALAILDSSMTSSNLNKSNWRLIQFARILWSTKFNTKARNNWNRHLKEISVRILLKTSKSGGVVLGICHFLHNCHNPYFHENSSWLFISEKPNACKLQQWDNLR